MSDALASSERHSVYEVGRKHAELDAVTTHVQLLTGKPPRTVDDFLREHRGAFSSSKNG